MGDGKGKSTSLTKEQLVRGKRLFLAACSVCHVGGGTRTNQNVGLAMEELSGALPARNTIEGIVDYLNAPTSYDGLKDISENHPSIKSADLFPKMRSMKQRIYTTSLPTSCTIVRPFLRSGAAARRTTEPPQP